MCRSLASIDQAPSLLALLLSLALPYGCGPSDHVGVDEYSELQAGASGVGSAGAASGGSDRAGASAGQPHVSGSGGTNVLAGSGGDPGSAAGGGGAGTGAPLAGVEAGSGGASGDGAAGSASAGTAADGGRPTAQDPECDSSGVWIARLTTFSRDSVFNSVQTASNWFYYELAQAGREVVVTRSLDCGMQVSGSADVTINAATTRALLHRNDQAGRKGEFYKDADHCTFRLARFYSTRGAARATYLPDDLAHSPELDALAPALPTEAMPAGAEDWDGDGSLGLAFNVAGLGARHVVQRDWNEYSSVGDPSTPIAFHANELVAAASFDSEEHILAVSGGLGALLRAGATPANGMRHRIAFRRLGRDVDDPAVAAIRDADELETCYNIQDAMPHDATMQ
jgi:hypothetical protein